MGLSGTLWDSLGLFGTFWDFLGLSVTFRDSLGHSSHQHNSSAVVSILQFIALHFSDYNYKEYLFVVITYTGGSSTSLESLNHVPLFVNKIVI